MTSVPTGPSDEAHEADSAAAITRANLKARSVHGAAASLIGQGCKLVLRLASTVILARLLSPADFGIFAMVAPLVLLAQTMNEVGLAQVIIQRRSISPEQLSGLFWLTLITGLALALLLALLSPLVAVLYREDAAGEILRALAAVLLISTAATVPGAVLARKLRIVAQVSIDVLATAASVAAAIVAAMQGLHFWSLVVGQAVFSAANLAMSFLVSGWRPFRPRVPRDVGSIVRSAVQLTGANFFSFLTATADNMIIGVAVGKSALGIYDRSYATVVLPVSQLISPVSRVAIPLLSRLHDDKQAFRAAFRMILTTAGLLGIPVMLFAILFAEPLVFVLFGPAWGAAPPVLAWLCVGGAALPIHLATSWAFISEGRSADYLRISAITSAISIASFALGTIWGILGVAIVAAISFVAIQTPLMVSSSLRGGSLIWEDFQRSLFPLVPAGIASGAALYFFPFRTGIVALGAALILSYVAAIIGLIATSGGRALLQRLFELRSQFRKARKTA